MIVIHVEKAAVNHSLLIEQLQASLPGISNNYNSQNPYPGWVDLLLDESATQSQQDEAVQIVADHDHTQETQAQQTFDAVKALAQSAVGIELTALTDNQKWALLGVLLWKAGAITDDATIAPLIEWAK